MVTLWGHDISWFVWFCAAGKSFFVGTALLTFAVLFPGLRKKTWSTLIKYFFTIAGIFLIALSATPLVWWFYAAWIVAVFVFFMLGSLRTSLALKWVRLSRVSVVCFCVIALVMELPYHLRPQMPKGNFETLYVVGDSISAGVGGEDERTWPKILNQKYGIEVIDLSVPGATVASAIQQADQVDSKSAIVLLEIGGNDLFAPTPYALFEQDLRQIMKRVSGPKQLVVILELPLQPWGVPYGAIQRKLAREFNATLVPKSFFISVLASKGATVDLAHLSPNGHELMSEKIWFLLGACFGATGGSGD
jgi:lysophospholipase L1-like esterase